MFLRNWKARLRSCPPPAQVIRSLRSTWGPTGAVRARRPRPTCTTSTGPTEAAEPRLRTSPTSRSGNLRRRAGRLTLPSTDVRTSTPPVTRPRCSATPHPVSTTPPAVKTTIRSTKAAATCKTRTITRSPLPSRKTATTWTSTSLQLTLDLAARPSTSTPLWPRRPRLKCTPTPTTSTLTTSSSVGSSTAQEADSNPSPSPAATP